MFLITLDKSKALDMTDIKSYFIYPVGRFGRFPTTEEINDKNTEFELWANTRWHNEKFGDCDQWRVGIFTGFVTTQKIMNTLISINPYATGKAVIWEDEVEFLNLK